MQARYTVFILQFRRRDSDEFQSAGSSISTRVDGPNSLTITQKKNSPERFTFAEHSNFQHTEAYISLLTRS